MSKAKRKPIVLWGATGQAVVIEEFLRDVGFELKALFDRSPDRQSPFAGIPIFTGPDALRNWSAQRPAGHVWFSVAIGGEHGRDRCEVFGRLVEAGLTPATLVHPRAFVATNASIGAGSVIHAQAAVCARARLGECVIVNTGASVDHDSVLGDGVHIGPGARLAGCVTVGDATFVATGALVAPRVSIGEDTIVGAGSLVLADVPANVAAWGTPARIVRGTNRRGPSDVDGVILPHDF